MNSIQELENLIKYHKALYYQGRPVISDAEYDKLEDSLRELDPDNAALEIVGSTTTGRKVKHDKKMLSLAKTYKVDELKKWAQNNEVVSTLKIDGVSCSLVYEGGRLVMGKTRGDGSFGEEITEKVAWMDSVPSVISSKENKIEVRGELFCTEKDFFALSDEMENIGLEKPTSQRNIVAGLVSRKENIELCRYIQFRAFDIIGTGVTFEKEYEKEKLLKTLGFIPEEFVLHKNFKTIEKEIERAREFMSEGDYQIDGLVFTLNDYKVHKALGSTAHHPRYKIAFKYQGETKNTKISEITWSVSRNGILTPVAEIEPVELSGAKLSRVTLHNYGMVKQFNLKPGDEIEIVRSGEVIPKFLSVVKGVEGRFEIPQECPSCKGKIEVVDIRLFCLNEKCPGKIKENILNFIQKIGIDDLSSKRLEEMILKNLVVEIPDLYKLKKGQLLILDKVQEKLEEKLLSNIQSSKHVDLPTFLSALGIMGGAYNKCEKVVSAGFDDIEKILNLTKEDLISIDSFAEKSASEFLSSLKAKHSLIKKLLKLGFNFEKEEKKEGFLSDKKIAITGALSDKRSNIETKIRSSGGKIVSSVSKNTDILLTNEQTSSSSKFKKAQELGIMVITEEELKKYL